MSDGIPGNEDQDRESATRRAVDLNQLLSRIEALEAKMANMEQANANNAPAMRAAWMHVPIGSAGPIKTESLGEPFSSVLHDNLDDLYER